MKPPPLARVAWKAAFIRSGEGSEKDLEGELDHSVKICLKVISITDLTVINAHTRCAIWCSVRGLQNLTQHRQYNLASTRTQASHRRRGNLMSQRACDFDQSKADRAHSPKEPRHADR